MTVEFLNLGKQQLNWIDQLLKQYIPHSNASFSNHLYRTGALLQKWGADPDTVIAGKYHAIYSTSSFEFSLVPITNRIEVASLLGNRAEFLIWCYCFLNYDWFWKYFDEIGCYSDAYAQGSKQFMMVLCRDMGYVILSSSDIKAIGAIILANHIEQSSRIPQYYHDDELVIKLYTPLKCFLPLIPAIHRLKAFAETVTQEVIISLHTLLNWDPFYLNTKVQSDYVACCVDNLQQLLRQIDQTPAHDYPLQYLFAQLPPLMQEQCALSPKVVNISTYKPTSLTNSDHKLVSEWLYRQSASVGLLSLDQVCSGLTLSDDGIVQAERRMIFPTPTLLGSIKLNFDEYYDLPLSTTSEEDVKHVAGEDRFETINRLQVSFDAIAKVQPAIVDFIGNNIVVLAIRKGAGAGFSSSSWPRYPGLVGLVNIDPDVSIERICSALIHECIHNFLYKIELYYPFTIDNNRLFGIQVKSLWTGRIIPISSYVHACCVWYGLYNFWRRYTQIQPSNIKASHEHGRAASGFKTPAYLDTLDDIKPYIRTDVFKLLKGFYLHIHKSQ